MTNEEIEKRFKFDLEMEIFNTCTSNKGNYIPNPVSYFISASSTDIEKLKTVLDKLGFIDDTPMSLDVLDKKIIKICRYDNTYSFFVKNRYNAFVMYNFNFIPDYIKEYKLE